MNVKASCNIAVVMIVLATGACGRAQDDPQVAGSAATTADMLAQLARDTGLPIIDLSIPIDRFSQAPATLEGLGTNLKKRVPGIYMMRYHDDSLRSIIHIFECQPHSLRYITISATAAGPPIRATFIITGVTFDAISNTLTLISNAQTIVLTPQDVTPAGA